MASLSCGSAQMLRRRERRAKPGVRSWKLVTGVSIERSPQVFQSLAPLILRHLAHLLCIQQPRQYQRSSSVHPNASVFTQTLEPFRTYHVAIVCICIRLKERKRACMRIRWSLRCLWRGARWIRSVRCNGYGSRLLRFSVGELVSSRKETV
jgi:hypothetical protein